MSQGTDYASATRQAYGIVYGMVQQQAAMLAFVKAFRFLGFLFFLVTPLILLMRRPRRVEKGGMGED
jgi:hypothetical protein